MIKNMNFIFNAIFKTMEDNIAHSLKYFYHGLTKIKIPFNKVGKVLRA